MSSSLSLGRNTGAGDFWFPQAFAKAGLLLRPVLEAHFPYNVHISLS